MPLCNRASEKIDVEYLTVHEAVALGYCAESTLRRWIRLGRLPAVKIGGRVKIRPSDLEALARPVTSDPASDEDLNAAIKRLVAKAPALSPGQVRELAAIFRGVAA